MNRFTGIVLTGVASGTAYLAAQAIDLAFTRNKLDDRIMLGRMLPIKADRARSAGTAMHLVNSVVFSAVFRLVGRDLLKGPMWWRGLVFANVENALLFPLAILEDFHPAIRDGHLTSYQSITAFGQQVWRHVALGIVLGALTPEKDG